MIFYVNQYQDEYGRISLKITTVKFEPEITVSFCSRSEKTSTTSKHLEHLQNS